MLHRTAIFVDRAEGCSNTGQAANASIPVPGRAWTAAGSGSSLSALYGKKERSCLK
jgi:hypothetical protein